MSAVYLIDQHFMKLCKPMVEKDLPKNPDYVNISPSNDVIRKLESLEYKEPFSMISNIQV